MNNIDKFNGKYLQCKITKYASAIKQDGIFANSGALVIYHPDNEQNLYYSNTDEYYNRDYIYLGDEFLASGYGFLCKDMRDHAETIVKNYDETIERLDNADATETSNRITADNEINKKFNDYVLINGGNISQTIVNIEDQNVNTIDILLYGEEARYKNLEVTNIIVKINNVEIDGNNVYLPLGSKIKRIDVIVEYDVNDSGGIEKIEVLHNNLLYDNLIQNPDETPIESVVVEYDLDSAALADQGILKYTKKFDDESAVYLTETIEGIISGFNIYVRRTTEAQYKNYPRLEEVKNIHIKSIGNIIDNNKLEILKPINVIPTYSMFYCFLNNDNNDNQEYTINDNNINTNTNIINYNTNTISYDNIEKNKLSLEIKNNFEISLSPSEYNKTSLYFALPKQYYLNNLYVITKNHEKYNWSGAVLKYLNTYDLLVNKITQSNDLSNNIENDNNHNYAIEYNLYKIDNYETYVDETQKTINVGHFDNVIILDIGYDQSIQNEIKTIENIDSRPPLLISDMNININNEIFNSLYWVTLKNEHNTEIISKLNAVKYNGIEYINS